MKNNNTKNIIIVTLLVVIFLLVCVVVKSDRREKTVIPPAAYPVVINQLTTAHRLGACDEAYGLTVKEREDYYASSSSAVGGYRVFVDCLYAVNSYYPEQKDEYFFVENSQNHRKYYVHDGKKYVMGGFHIIGVKDNFLFYNECYEGCTASQYFQVDTTDTQSEVVVYPETLDVLYRQGLPSGSFMEIYKDKVLLLSAHKIQELSIPDFKLTDLKVIEDNKVFGVYGDLGGEFIPKFEKKNGGILFSVYKNENVGDEGKVVDTYFLPL